MSNFYGWLTKLLHMKTWQLLTLLDHNEDAGLTAFLEDFEEDYYTDGDIRGDFNPEDTATSSTTAELIYEGAQITYDESLLLTMAFALRHKISLAAVDDLLELLRIHCPEVNSMVQNISQFQQHFRKLNHPIKQHFCCPLTKTTRCMYLLRSHKKMIPAKCVENIFLQRHSSLKSL